MERLRGREAYPIDFGNKKPARTFRSSGHIRFFGYALGGSGSPYANRP